MESTHCPRSSFHAADHVSVRCVSTLIRVACYVSAHTALFLALPWSLSRDVLPVSPSRDLQHTAAPVAVVIDPSGAAVRTLHLQPVVDHFVDALGYLEHLGFTPRQGRPGRVSLAVLPAAHWVDREPLPHNRHHQPDHAPVSFVDIQRSSGVQFRSHPEVEHVEHHVGRLLEHWHLHDAADERQHHLLSV